MSNLLRIGTRGSRLAMTQTEWVAGRLRAAHPDLEVRTETFRTAGDRDRATPVAHLPGVGFFVKELETALLDGRIDLAVHSMKDVPTLTPDGLAVEAAVPEREDVRECLVTLTGLRLEELPQGATVGSSSPRRRAMLLAVRPDLAFMDLRGNVETRLAKLAKGVCQATVLAAAGLTRLGMLDRRMVKMDTGVMLPAAGQGALGLEFRSEDAAVRQAVWPLDHPPTRWAIAAERALVRRLGAGCRTPLGVLARVDGDGMLTLAAHLLSADGRQTVRQVGGGDAPNAVRLGTVLAERLLLAGAERMLAPAPGGHEDGARDA